MSETTDEKQRPAHLFKPGQSGNPNGRPKGSRNKLGEQFLSDLQADWEEHGKTALEDMRKDKPNEYVRVVASILPKELLVRKDPLSDMTEAEIDERLDALEQFIADARSGGSTPRPTHTTQGRA